MCYVVGSLAFPNQPFAVLPIWLLSKPIFKLILLILRGTSHKMGKRGKKVPCVLKQSFILVDMLTDSRVVEVEVEAASDDAEGEQTILGGREQTKLRLIVTMIDMKCTTTSLGSWVRMRKRSFGKLCGVIYQTASGSRDLKRTLIKLWIG